jgi:hypothetical protein
MSELALGQAFGEGLKSFPRTIAIYGCVALVGAFGLTGLEIATKLPEPSIFPKISTPVPDEYQPVGTYTPDRNAPALVAAIKQPRMPDWEALSIDLLDYHGIVWPRLTLAPSTADLPASSAFLIRAASMPNRTFQSLFEWSALAWNSDPMSSRIIATTQGPGGITYHVSKSGPVAHRDALSAYDAALSGAGALARADALCAPVGGNYSQLMQVRSKDAQEVDGFNGQDMSQAGVRRNAARSQCVDLATTLTKDIQLWSLLIGGILLGMSMGAH